jgi:hypothetical protein
MNTVAYSAIVFETIASFARSGRAGVVFVLTIKHRSVAYD